jgi:lipid II:glycine glycyltransferase (peptidoglycan interpeptide bridge formation enzyme)
VIEIDASREIDTVWEVFAKTATRGGFHLHPKSYYQTMLEVLDSGECRAFLATARVGESLIAANIMIDHAGVRTYLHGASDHEYRKLMAPYLLHWELIKDAQEKGMASYDWWGVAPPGEKNHAWAGITRFKEGFGGERIMYPGTYDLILRPGAYKAYELLRLLRRTLRS